LNETYLQSIRQIEANVINSNDDILKAMFKRG